MAACVQTLVLFDTESTGLPSPGNNPKITELCFLALTREEFLHKLSQPRVLCKLVLCLNPRKMIGPKSAEISGLHNDALEQLGTFKKQSNLVVEFLANLPQPVCLIAHNGNGFDFPLLRAELKRADQSLPCQVLCIDSLEALREMDGLPRKRNRAAQTPRPGSGGKQESSPEKVTPHRVKVKEATESPGEKRLAGDCLVSSPSKFSAREPPHGVAKMVNQSFSAMTPVKEDGRVGESWRGEEVTPLRKPPNLSSGLSLQYKESVHPSHTREEESKARRQLFEDGDGGSANSGILDSQETVPYSLNVNCDVKDPQGLPSLTDSELEMWGAIESAENLNQSEGQTRNNENSTDRELIEAGDHPEKVITESESGSTASLSQEGASHVAHSSCKLQQCGKGQESPQDLDKTRGKQTEKERKEDEITKTVKAPVTPSTQSYRLGEVYARTFGQRPEVAHAAEDDCVTLMKILRLKGPSFVNWCDINAVSLDSIEPMYK